MFFDTDEPRSTTRGPQLPDTYVPYPPTCHHLADEIDREAVAWAAAYAPASVVRDLEKTRPGQLAARTVSPDAPKELLRAYAHMITWGFWFDDAFVDDAAADAPSHLPAITSVLDVLDKGHGTGAAGERLEAALQDLIADVRSAVTPAALTRWATEMRLWFASLTLQNSMRAARTTPTVESYKTMRLYTVCCFPCIVLIDSSWPHAQGDPYDPVGWDDYWAPDAAALRIHASNVTAWQNDVFSYFAERDHPGSFWNLPSVYAAHGLTVEKALHRAAADAADEITAFDRRVAALPRPGSAALRCHIRSLTNWMRGCHDWSLEATERYTGWGD